MKKEHLDFAAASEMLTEICLKFTKIEDNKRSWTDLFSKSDKQVAVKLIQEFKKCSSTPELITKIAQYDSNPNVFETLIDAVVLKILAISTNEIERVGLEITTADLIFASRGYIPIVPGLKLAPNVSAAKKQVFNDYVKYAKSIPTPAVIELA